jgi:hypothetical protein
MRPPATAALDEQFTQSLMVSLRSGEVQQRLALRLEKLRRTGSL